MAEFGEIVKILGRIVAFASEIRPGSHGSGCGRCPGLEGRPVSRPVLGELHHGGSCGWWKLGPSPPVGRPVEGVAPVEQVVAPVGGIGEAPIGVLRPLLLHGMYKVRNQTLHSSFSSSSLKLNLILIIFNWVSNALCCYCLLPGRYADIVPYIYIYKYRRLWRKSTGQKIVGFERNDKNCKYKFKWNSHIIIVIIIRRFERDACFAWRSGISFFFGRNPWRVDGFAGSLIQLDNNQWSFSDLALENNLSVEHASSLDYWPKIKRTSKLRISSKFSYIGLPHVIYFPLYDLPS